jgi:hypothetical protein
MHDALTRQLIAPAAACLLMLTTERSTLAGESPASSAADQLRAAALAQVALRTRDASPAEWQRLEQTYASLVAQFPRDDAVRNAHAECLWDMGEHSRGIAEWEAAERINPANPQVLEHLGEAALESGEARKSAAYFSRLVAAAPANAAGHFALANVCFLFRHELLDAAHPDAGRLITDALWHFREASRLAPANAEYARAYAETFYSLPAPDWTAALAAWEHFRRLTERQDFAALQLARIHLKLGHSDAARTLLNSIQDSRYQTLKEKLQAQLRAKPVVPPAR